MAERQYHARNHHYALNLKTLAYAPDSTIILAIDPTPNSGILIAGTWTQMPEFKCRLRLTSKPLANDRVACK